MNEDIKKVVVVYKDNTERVVKDGVIFEMKNLGNNEVEFITTHTANCGFNIQDVAENIIRFAIATDILEDIFQKITADE